MEVKEKINTEKRVVRCFNIISREKDPKFGLKCKNTLIYKNSVGEVAGEIKCIRCGAIYEMIDGYLKLIKRE